MGVGLVAQGREAIGEEFERLIIAPEQLAVAVRADREVMIVVLDMERAALGIETQGQGAFLQCHAVVAAQKRQQQLAFHQGVGGMPLDIEELAVGAQASPFEQVQPPGIVTAADGHVIGNNVEDQPHVLFTQGRYQAAQRRFAAQFRVNLGRVHHIVAMHGPGARCEQGRGVHVADAQTGEIRHQGHRLIQGEVFMELQAQSRAQRLD